MKELYKLINEEISGFDFLGVEKINKEENNKKVLNSKQFQTEFVNDIISNQKDKNKFPKISSSIQIIDNDNTFNDVDKNVEIETSLMYRHNEHDFKLVIFLDGSILEDNEPDYNSFDVKIYTKSGDKLDISWIFSNKVLIEKFIDSLVTKFL